MYLHRLGTSLGLLALTGLIFACHDTPLEPRRELTPSVRHDGTGGASIITDKKDYQPGDTVLVTGSGFQAGESVTLVFTEDTVIHAPDTLRVTAGDGGSITSHSFVLQHDDLGRTFRLVATGAASGVTAQASFTDSFGVSSISPTVGGLAGGTTVQLNGSFSTNSPFGGTTYSYMVSFGFNNSGASVGCSGGCLLTTLPASLTPGLVNVSVTETDCIPEPFGQRFCQSFVGSVGTFTYANGTMVVFNAQPSFGSTMYTGMCTGPLTPVSETSNFQVAAPAAGTVVSLASSSRGAQFFADPGCITPVASIPFPASSTQLSFYYLDPNVGTPDFIFSGSGLTPVHTGAVNVASSNGIVANGLRIRSGATTSISPGQCAGPFVINTFLHTSAQDGPTALPPANTLATLTSSSSGVFFGDPNCAIAMPSQFALGPDQPFYYLDFTNGTPTVMATTAALGVASAPVSELNVPTFAGQALISTGVLKTFVCNQILLNTVLKGGTPASPPPNTFVTLSSPSPTAAFYSDPKCTNPETASGIPWPLSAGTALTVYYLEKTAGPTQISVMSSSFSSTTKVTVDASTLAASVTLSNTTQTYDGTAKLPTVATMPAGLSYTLQLTDQTGATVASAVNAGTYNVTATVTDPVYVGATTGTLVIAKADQSINVGAIPSHQYGDAPFALTATATSRLAVGFTASGPCTVAGHTLTITGAGNCTVSATQAGDGNYNAAPAAAQAFVISRAPLLIGVTSLSKRYGDPLPSFSPTYGGFVYSDSPTSLSGTLTFQTGATQSSSVGTYAVRAAGLTSANYDISYTDGQLSITRAPLTITADNKTMIYGAASLPAFTASYSGFVLSDTPASLGGSLTFATSATSSSPVGTYAVTPQGATSNNYSITFTAGTLQVIYNSTVGHVFLPPINISGTPTSIQLGRTLPVKFQIFAANGTTAVSTVVANIGVKMLNTSTDYPVNTDGLSTTPDQGTRFRYDATAQQYIFNLDTSALTAGTWQISATLDDGSVVQAVVVVRH